jgi:hypothetical protein
MLYRNELATLFIPWALGTIFDAIPTDWRRCSAERVSSSGRNVLCKGLTWEILVAFHPPLDA